MGWRLMGGGEFDCLHKKVKSKNGYYFLDTRQTREGDKGKGNRMVRFAAKHKYYFWVVDTKNNYGSLFYAFLYFQNVWNIMYFYKKFYKALLEEQGLFLRKHYEGNTKSRHFAIITWIFKNRIFCPFVDV